jgi:E3 ubiquitin-protein ligase NEDD4
VLQGIDSNIKKFTIHGVDRVNYVFPRAHTCFNRIDLPTYNNKKELYDRLKTAITMSAVGFGIE